MKKYTVGLIFLCLSLSNLYTQSLGSGGFCFHYANANRPGLESYFETISDSMDLDEVLNIHGGAGFGIRFLFGTEHLEYEVGGGYTRSADEIGSETENQVSYNNSDISMNFGVNYLPVNFFLLGGSFIINSANAKSLESGEGFGDKQMELLPSVNFHIFRGYSVALRAQSGFYIYTNKDDNNRMRLTAYYTYGITEYNFYTVSEKRLAGYTGDQKTHYDIAGIELAFLFGF